MKVHILYGENLVVPTSEIDEIPSFQLLNACEFTVCGGCTVENLSQARFD